MTKRIAHITRVYKDNDNTSNTWIDVERIDELWLVSSGGQRNHWIFDWENFDEALATKKTISDPNDSANEIEVPVRTRIHVNTSQLASNHLFLNDGTNKTRETHSRTIYHHEIKKAYLVDGEPPSDPDQYLDALGKQDPGQFVEVELLDNYWTAEDEPLDYWRHRKEFSLRQQKKKWIPATTDLLLQEPLKPTDIAVEQHEPVRNPDAGPQVDPPWRLDPLQNIVNVSWGGLIVFVTGTIRGFCMLAEKTEELEWADLGTLEFSDTGQVYCSSYANVGGTPIFLLGGGAEPNVIIEEFDNDSDALIMASDNGRDWSEVLRVSPDGVVGGKCAVLEIVWSKDEGKFYAGISSFQRNSTDITELNAVEAKIYTSSDGQAWSPGGTVSVPMDAASDWGSPISSHYHPTANLPDGLFGYDEIKNDAGVVTFSVLVKPTNPPKPHYSAVNMDDFDGGGDINITRKTGELEETRTVTTPFNVYCAAYAGGFIVVGGVQGEGAGATASSNDDGEHWASGTTGDSVILTVSGGKKK